MDPAGYGCRVQQRHCRQRLPFVVCVHAFTFRRVPCGTGKLDDLWQCGSVAGGHWNPAAASCSHCRDECGDVDVS